MPEEQQTKSFNPSDISKANIERLGEDKEILLQQISSELKESEITLQPWKERVVKYYELYKMYQSKKHYEGLAQIFVPEILRAVETIVGNLYKIITGNNPWFEYEGRTPEEDPSALAQTQLTMYQMDENNFKPRLMDSLRQMAVTGLTVRKVLWDFRQVPRTRKNYVEENKGLDPITGKPVSFKRWKQEKFLDTVKDHWTFDPVDLLSLHVPDITVPYNDMQKSRWIAEQYVVDREWVRERAKKGWIVSVDLDEIGGDEKNPPSSRSRVLKENRIRTSGFVVKSNRPGSLEIIERWGLLKASYVYSPEQLQEQGLEADEFVETVLIVANQSTILKLEANPFWHNQKPYLFCPYVPVEFEFDGMGVAQVGEKLQEELNDTRNQLMDNKTLILMTMWLKSRSSGIKNSDLRVRPLGVIQTNDMNGLTALRPPVVTGIGINIEGTIKNDLRESVGAASNLQGIAQSGIGSATEASMIAKDSVGRLALTAELYGELILKPMLIMVEYLNYQFYDHTKVIRIIGPQGIKWRKVTPEELIGYKEVSIKISTDVGNDPATMRQQAMQFLTIVQQMPPQMIQFHYKLLDKIWKLFYGGRSLSEVYDPPQEPDALLTVEEEVDLILANYPLVPKMRDDAADHAHQLSIEFDKYKFGLSPQSFEIFKAVILAYQQMAHDQLMAAQAQLKMQQMALLQGGGKGANMNGQIPGASTFTQPQGAGPTGAQAVGA